MDLRISFGNALKKFRKARKLSQEDFSDVSSRTYLSTLERGLKSPTLEKICDIAMVLNVHPLTILISTFTSADEKPLDETIELVRKELHELSN